MALYGRRPAKADPEQRQNVPAWHEPMSNMKCRMHPSRQTSRTHEISATAARRFRYGGVSYDDEALRCSERGLELISMCGGGFGELFNREVLDEVHGFA